MLLHVRPLLPMCLYPATGEVAGRVRAGQRRRGDSSGSKFAAAAQRVAAVNPLAPAGVIMKFGRTCCTATWTNLAEGACRAEARSRPCRTPPATCSAGLEVVEIFASRQPQTAEGIHRTALGPRHSTCIHASGPLVFGVGITPLQLPP